jgi:hypothetical protein
MMPFILHALTLKSNHIQLHLTWQGLQYIVDLLQDPTPAVMHAATAIINIILSTGGHWAEQVTMISIIIHEAHSCLPPVSHVALHLDRRHSDIDIDQSHL